MAVFLKIKLGNYNKINETITKPNDNNISVYMLGKLIKTKDIKRLNITIENGKLKDANIKTNVPKEHKKILKQNGYNIQEMEEEWKTTEQ